MGTGGARTGVFDGASVQLRQLLESRDWASSAVGPVSTWSPVLRTTVQTALHSRFPTIVSWGQEFIAVYNDAQVPLLGAKHPAALGRAPAEVWPESWPWIAPRMNQVLVDGESLLFHDERQILQRNGYPEECYFTLSQSPLTDIDGRIGGVLTVATETTGKVLSERRLRLVAELAGLSLAGTGRIVDILQAAIGVLATVPESVPFAVAYTAGSAAKPGNAPEPVQVAGYGFDGVSDRAPGALVRDLEARVRSVLASGFPAVVTGLRARGVGVLSPGPLGLLRPEAAVLWPLKVSGRPDPVGALLLGVNPYRPLDPAYEEFFALLGRQLQVMLTEAAAHESEQHRLRLLADLDRAKTEFYQNVSHELRTPLTLLLAPLQDLQTAIGQGEPPRADDVELAVRAASRMRTMVDGLLDVSGAAPGALTPDNRICDLSTLTADTVSMFRSTAQHAGLALSVQLPEGRTVAKLDPSMWSTIVTNLVANAVKYTVNGKVEIRLEPSSDDAVLTVSDTGVGISAEDRVRVFQRFHRGASGGVADGAGIGLSLVADLVRALNGRIDLDSTPGRGTTVTVTVPLAPERTSSTTEAPQTPGATWDGPRVLVVEDDTDLRGYLTRLLTNDGWQVISAPDGETALKLARSADAIPDLVVTDVMLPGLSGLQVVDELRRAPDTGRLPIIVVTGRGGTAAAAEGLAAGADDYITKPFSSSELLARVRAAHELHRMREAAVDDAQNRAEQIRGALDSNRVIGTATGIVMATYRLTADHAFRLLQLHSQNSNTKLRDVAAQVVDNRALRMRPTDIDDLLIRVATKR